MAKDPARVAAGKKAWANLSAAAKAKVRARLKRVRPKSTGSTRSRAPAATSRAPSGGGSTGRGGSTSNNKKSRQNIFTTVANVLTLVTSLHGVIDAARLAMRPTGKFAGKLFFDRLVVNYSGYDPRTRDARQGRFLGAHLALNGWAPIGAAFGFRKGYGFVAKAAPLNKRMGFMTKATSILARILSLAGMGIAAGDAVKDRTGLTGFTSNATENYTGVEMTAAGNGAFNATGQFNIAHLAKGYGTQAIGWGLKKAFSTLAKAVPLNVSSSPTIGI